ncbi:MAG TPA: hypothetical protein VF753_05530 [Terriglobales bacterium]
MQNTGIPEREISPNAAAPGSSPPDGVDGRETISALAPPPVAVRYTGFDLWLHRLTMLLLVFVCAIVGVLLLILPWRPEWTDNHLLLNSPDLRAFVASGFVRGVCSGLGLLDIWIGFWEAIHYHEFKHH